MKNLLLIMLLSLVCAGFSSAQESKPVLFHDEIAHTVGITGLEDVYGPGSGCEIHRGPFSVSGVQYSESGNTIKLIQFKRGDGKIFAIPTNFEKIDKADLDLANDLIQKDKIYFISFTTCGSGGFMSLVDIYQAYK